MIMAAGLKRNSSTHGKFTCQSIAQRCPAYVKEHSARIKEHWQRPESALRRENTTAMLLKTACTPQSYAKMKETKRKKSGLLTPELAKNYRSYARAIRQRAQQWASEQGYVLGQQTFHVDHKLSILDAWNANLTLEIVNHPVNLQVIEAKLNSTKGAKSILSVEELLKLIGDS